MVQGMQVLVQGVRSMRPQCVVKEAMRIAVQQNAAKACSKLWGGQKD